MPQAIADPEELERFAKNLQQFDRDLSTRMSQLKGQFATGVYMARSRTCSFCSGVPERMAVLERFIRDADKHIPLLTKKASILRDYLNRG